MKDFFDIVNDEHMVYELEQQAKECSKIARFRTENRKIMRVNSALIKLSAIMASVTILTLIIK